VSFRHTGQQQKTPDGCMCCDDDMSRKVGDCWPNADAAENDVRDWRAVVHQVPRCLVVLALVHQHTQLVLHSIRNVKPVKLDVHEMSQTAIKFPRVTNNACGRIQHSLQLVCCCLQRPGEDCIAVIHMGSHEDMDKCHSRVRLKSFSNIMELSKPEKSCCANIADMLV